MPGDWRSFQFAVPPGHWRLRFSEPGERPPFELPLTVCPAYRVEVVAPLCSTWQHERRSRAAARAPAAARTTRLRWIFLLAGFEEAALRALGSGRTLYGQDFEQLIDNLVGDKVHNPMLGILAAHLCDRGRDDDLPFQERLLSRLDSLTGLPAIVHPDVAALRLRFLMRTGQSIDNEPAGAFPAAACCKLGCFARCRAAAAIAYPRRFALRASCGTTVVVEPVGGLECGSARDAVAAACRTRSATAEAKVATDDFASLSGDDRLGSCQSPVARLVPQRAQRVAGQRRRPGLGRHACADAR